METEETLVKLFKDGVRCDEHPLWLFVKDIAVQQIIKGNRKPVTMEHWALLAGFNACRTNGGWLDTATKEAILQSIDDYKKTNGG